MRRVMAMRSPMSPIFSSTAARHSSRDRAPSLHSRMGSRKSAARRTRSSGGAAELRAVRDDGVVDVEVDPEVEAGGELDRAEDAHRIFAESHVGVADGADDAALDVDHAAHPVEDLAAVVVVEERVDGEI